MTVTTGGRATRSSSSPSSDAELQVEGLEQLAVLVLGRDDLDDVVELLTEQLERRVVDRLGRGDHLAEVEQHLHQRGRRRHRSSRRSRSARRRAADGRSRRCPCGRARRRSSGPACCRTPGDAARLDLRPRRDGTAGATEGTLGGAALAGTTAAAAATGTTAAGGPPRPPPGGPPKPPPTGSPPRPAPPPATAGTTGTARPPRPGPPGPPDGRRGRHRRRPGTRASSRGWGAACRGRDRPAARGGRSVGADRARRDHRARGRARPMPWRGERTGCCPDAGHRARPGADRAWTARAVVGPGRGGAAVPRGARRLGAAAAAAGAARALDVERLGARRGPGPRRRGRRARRAARRRAALGDLGAGSGRPARAAGDGCRRGSADSARARRSSPAPSWRPSWPRLLPAWRPARRRSLSWKPLHDGRLDAGRRAFTYSPRSVSMVMTSALLTPYSLASRRLGPCATCSSWSEVPRGRGPLVGVHAHRAVLMRSSHRRLMSWCSRSAWVRFGPGASVRGAASRARGSVPRAGPPASCRRARAKARVRSASARQSAWGAGAPRGLVRCRRGRERRTTGPPRPPRDHSQQLTRGGSLRHPTHVRTGPRALAELSVVKPPRSTLPGGAQG